MNYGIKHRKWIPFYSIWCFACESNNNICIFFFTENSNREYFTFQSNINKKWSQIIPDILIFIKFVIGLEWDIQKRLKRSKMSEIALLGHSLHSNSWLTPSIERQKNSNKNEKWNVNYCLHGHFVVTLTQQRWTLLLSFGNDVLIA